jgi:hypothetical protein
LLFEFPLPYFMHEELVGLDFVIIDFPFKSVDFVFAFLLCRGEALLDLLASSFLFILVPSLPFLCLLCEDLLGVLDEEGLLDYERLDEGLLCFLANFLCFL